MLANRDHAHLVRPETHVARDRLAKLFSRYAEAEDWRLTDSEAVLAAFSRWQKDQNS